MSSLTKKARIFTALTAPILLAGATLTVTTPLAHAGPTGADACTYPDWTNKSSGKGTAKGATAKLRSGPSEDCFIRYEIGTDAVLYYHCRVKNSVGNKWTHVRVRNSTYEGWVYNGNLSDGGSVHPDNQC
ncbi:SH3 domain-containing protein [Streptomyces netropsis]|uniref:SH3 domain-containing protein n=1 Tax=Streptomyces netropsis TaxID=55404 RepID=UPI0037BC92A3